MYRSTKDRRIKRSFFTEYSDSCFGIRRRDLPAPLSPQQEREILEKLQGKERKEATKTLIEHNLRLVFYIAGKFINTGEKLEDLVSAGNLGLVKAVHSLDRFRMKTPAAYISRCIENEILMYLRGNSKFGQEVSLDLPLTVDGEGNELFLTDLLGTEKDMLYKKIEYKADMIRLKKAIESLKENEWRILQLRYGIDTDDGKERTQQEVADLMGISQSYLSRLERKIIHRLKEEMTGAKEK